MRILFDQCSAVATCHLAFINAGKVDHVSLGFAILLDVLEANRVADASRRQAVLADQVHYVVAIHVQECVSSVVDHVPEHGQDQQLLELVLFEDGNFVEYFTKVNRFQIILNTCGTNTGSNAKIVR